MKRKPIPIFSMSIVLASTKEAIFMLSPHVQYKNPVMFVTYIGAIVTTFYLFFETKHSQFSWFNIQICIWLWFTVLFANFAQAMAEFRGKAQASYLKRTKTETFAKCLQNGIIIKVPASDLKCGDIVVCETGDIIPADGDVIEGVATIDESAITGESAPVIRESGGDFSAVTAGTRVLSDTISILVTSECGKSFLDKMISLIEGAQRQRTPNEVALNMVLSGLTIVFLLTTISLKIFADFSAQQSGQDLSGIVTVPILVALLVCLIPTTISALLSAVGIAGMDRLVQKNVIAKSGRSVEAAGDIDVLILDKTGTITIGNRMASAFLPVIGVDEKEFAQIAQLASISDETPEGRSIVILAKNLYGLRAQAFHPATTKAIPFSTKTRMSGVDFIDSDGKVTRSIRKGATDSIRKYVESIGGSCPQDLDRALIGITKSGGTPLLVSDGAKIVGIIHLKDILKGGIKERFIAMHKMGLKTIMVTGDNPLTAAAIAAESGVNDYVAEATPEIKLALIKKEQEGGRLVAMTGDGTNDAPALAQADVAVAMNTGTQASREAGNMIDLDSNPTKLLDIVVIGKQLLMTRGALTTFSIANDIAKYFAIIPAIFSTLYVTDGSKYGPLSALNIMYLDSPQSAILSAVIFNAVVIIALIPLALRGVQYQAQPPNLLLRNNLLKYGLGGIITPFIGIKTLDVLINYLGLIR